MYLEAVFCFYILLNHLVGYSLFWLITFCSLFNIIKRNFALTLAKLYFYIDYAVRFFVGKKYNRLVTSSGTFASVPPFTGSMTNTGTPCFSATS